MSTSQHAPAGGARYSERVLIDVRVLQGAGAGRGEGRYARGLLGGLLEAGFRERSVLLVDAGLPDPELLDSSWETISVRRRYHGRAASYEDAAVLGGDLATIRPAAYHALRLSLPGSAPCPVVVTLHDLIPWALGGTRMLGERLRHLPGRRLLSRADVVIAVSESTAADARRLGGVAPARIRVIGEGVEASFRAAPGAAERATQRWGLSSPFLLFVGALDARKSPADLVTALQAARGAGVKCELVVAGDPGPQAPSSLGDARLLGRVSDAELVDLLSAAGCLLFPSRYEGFGLPVLEAMACGCPAVLYANSSLPEVAGAAGILVPDGDAAEMGRQAARLLAEPEFRRHAAAAGVAHAASFTWAGVARQVIAVYDSLLR